MPVTQPTMHVATASSPAIDYELLVSALPGLYLVLAPDLSVLNATDAYLKSTMRSKADIIGRKLFDVFPENPAAEAVPNGPSLKKSLLHVLNFQTAHTIPVLRFDIARPNNFGGGFEERYWMTSNYPVTDKKGKLLYILHQVTDVTMQQMAQRRINTSRERYELLAQAASDVVWDWDLLNNHIWWSETLETIFGYNPYDFCNIEAWVQKVHPEDQAGIIKGIYDIADLGGKIWTDHYRFQRQDGTYAHVMERGYILRDESGVAYRMVGSMFDISEEVKSFASQQPAREEQFHFLEALPDLAWCIKPEAGAKKSLTHCNQAWQTYTGVHTDLLSQAEKLIPAEELEKTLAALNVSLRAQQPFEQEVRLKNAQSGQYRWFKARIAPVQDENQHLTAWLGTFTDIHDQKMARQHAEQVKNDWQNILNEAPLNAVIFDGKTHACEFASAGFQKFFYHPHQNDKITTEDLAPGFKDVLDSVSATGKPVHLPDSQNLLNGHAQKLPAGRHLTLDFKPILNASGQTENILVTATEEETTLSAPASTPAVTSTRETCQPLEVVMQQVTQTVRQPLANMAAIFEELTKSAAFNDPDAEELVRHFRKTLAQTHGALQELSAFTAPAPVATAVPVVLELEHVASEAVNQLQETLDQLQAAVTLNFSAAPTVRFQPEKLQSALVSLLSSSIKTASLERPLEITIASRASGNYTLVQLQDNGLGLSFAEKESEGASLPNFGPALSLYLLEQTVKQAGGRLEIESVPNQGTTFRLYLKKPVSRLLLLNEDETAAFLQKRLLKRTDAALAIDTQTSLAAAFQILQETAKTGNSLPDLIIFDLDGAGPQAATFLPAYARLRETLPQLPEMVLFSVPENLNESAGKYSFVRKAFPAALAETTAQALLSEFR